MFVLYMTLYHHPPPAWGGLLLWHQRPSLRRWGGGSRRFLHPLLLPVFKTYEIVWDVSIYARLLTHWFDHFLDLQWFSCYRKKSKKNLHGYFTQNRPTKTSPCLGVCLVSRSPWQTYDVSLKNSGQRCLKRSCWYWQWSLATYGVSLGELGGPMNIPIPFGNQNMENWKNNHLVWRFSFWRYGDYQVFHVCLPDGIDVGSIDVIPWILWLSWLSWMGKKFFLNVWRSWSTSCSCSYSISCNNPRIAFLSNYSSLEGDVGAPSFVRNCNFTLTGPTKIRLFSSHNRGIWRNQLTVGFTDIHSLRWLNFRRLKSTVNLERDLDATQMRVHQYSI